MRQINQKERELQKQSNGNKNKGKKIHGVKAETSIIQYSLQIRRSTDVHRYSMTYCVNILYGRIQLRVVRHVRFPTIYISEYNKT